MQPHPPFPDENVVMATHGYACGDWQTSREEEVGMNYELLQLRGNTQTKKKSCNDG